MPEYGGILDAGVRGIFDARVQGYIRRGSVFQKPRVRTI